MSSTRRADPNAPLSQERYMSSPEFAELRAISGTAVARRCALLASPGKRQLLWFIQGLSLAEGGGLKQLARELLAMFPERLVFPIRANIDWRSGDHEKLTRQECIQLALGRWSWPQHQEYPDIPSLEEFFIDLCINPRLQIRLKQGELETSGLDMDLARHEFPELESRDFETAELIYFRDIIGALVEYKHRFEERVKADFCPTAISRQIWKQLDDALKSKTMIVLDGREGRGKTEAVRAWCNCHLGVARFLSLKGRATMTAHFREFARALGVGHARAHTVSHMQAAVEEVLRTSQLMPVIDEAHFTFSQGPRMRTRPEMLDWIDTALCNPPLPVALITTPQFMDCMERAYLQVGWNYRQFKRRCKRYCRLPLKNTPEDIATVARHLLPGADKATIKEVLGYATLSKRDLSAIGDVVREARLQAEEAGAKKVSFDHVHRAIHEVLLVSDKPWAEMEKNVRDKERRRKGMPEAPALAAEAVQEPIEAPEREISPPLLPEGHSGNRLRFRQSTPALVEVPA